MATQSEGIGAEDKLFPGRYFVSTVLDLLDTKSRMSGSLWKVYLMRAAMAGIIISLFYMAFYGIQAIFDEILVGDISLLAVGKFVGSIVFGFALVFIYFSKSELLTSNMMVGSVGIYYDRRSIGRVARLMALCYVGNALGGLLIALLLLGSTLLDGDIAVIMEHSVDTKLGYVSGGLAGMSDLLVRAILCNLLINIAMLLCYNGVIKEDITKVVSMVVAVFLFAFLGLEHSVANTELFIMYGLDHGIDVGLAAANVAIAIVGNFIGGGILIGLYYAYANDYSRMVRTGRVQQQKQPEA